ncbi:transporter substrate-binding domain-containing protein [Shewanella salipaludis]|uniref:Transporter substrate-binding domain-containing protein n=1 Tax=Shewanella salipaludis TaxID=2723052 RepID=A0A972FV94_9GAMM|nr:transporter substrate-binding domain-containing protein [Shewanella salipaludis]NMH63868.1 transporter substrate-binding domain-containing protein [Shewanella salipaludis]
MKRVIHLVVIFCTFLLVLQSTAKAAAMDVAIDAAKGNAGHNPPPLVIVAGEDSYPFQFLDERGEVAGLLIELWQEWSRVTATPVVFVVRHWSESMEQLRQGHAQVHIGLGKTVQRSSEFDFSAPISEVGTYLYLHKSLKDKKQFKDLLPYQIGVVADSAHIPELQRLQPGLMLKTYPSREALLEAVSRGDLYIFAGMEGYLRDQGLQQDIMNGFPANIRIAIKKTPIRAAVRKGEQKLLAQIDSGFARLDKGFIQQAERRWLGYQRQQAGIRIAMPLGAEPYGDLGLDGQPHGLFVDIWQLWSEKTGISIDFVASDMNGSLKDVRNGIADVQIGYPENDELNSGLQRVWNLYTMKSRLFVYQQSLTDLGELKGKRIGVFPTSPYLAQLRQALPETQIRFYDSMAAMTAAARKGDITGFVASGALTSHYLLLTQGWGDFHQASMLEFSTHNYVLTREDEKGLAQRVASGFNSISLQELAAIERKWMLNPQDLIFTGADKRVALNDSQQAYLAGLGELKMGYLKHWSPMEFTDDAGKFAGINSDVAKLLTEQLGLKLVPQAFDDWQSLIQALLRGDIDLAGSVAETAERKQSLAFSAPYWPSPWALVSRLQQVSVFNLEQLSGQRLAVVEGYHLVPLLMSLQPGLKLVLVADSDAGLAAVAGGKADVFIDKVVTLAQRLQGGHFGELKLSLLADFSDQHSRLGINPKHAELVPLIDMALGMLDKPRQQRIYEHWLTADAGHRPLQIPGWLSYLLVSLLSLGLALVGLLIYRRHGAEAQLRRKLEKQLQLLGNHDSLTGLPNRNLLDDRLQQAVLLHGREQESFALVFVGLDEVKRLTKARSAKEMDRILLIVTGLLQDAVRESDTVARFGTEEFVLILNRIHGRDQVYQLVDSLLHGLTTAAELLQGKDAVSASIGVAFYPKDGDTAIDILKRAVQLSSLAKESGGSCYRVG